jgi:hypothetical protein
VIERNERILAFATGLVLLLLILATVLFGPQRDSGFAYVALRTILGLAAAAFVVIVPGFLEFNWPPVVRAGGALAAFAIVFFVNPPTPPAGAPTAQVIPRVHIGYLGNLHDHLQATTADNDFLLTLDEKHRNELRLFWIEPEISASTWSEVVRKICRRYSQCLACKPAAESISRQVEISWRGTPVRLPGPSGDAPKYTCAETTLNSGSPHQ